MTRKKDKWNIGVLDVCNTYERMENAGGREKKEEINK